MSLWEPIVVVELLVCMLSPASFVNCIPTKSSLPAVLFVLLGAVRIVNHKVLIVIGHKVGTHLIIFGFGFLPYFSALITNLHLDFVVATFTCVTVGVTTKGTYT